jgi:hypothetical protein
MKPMTLLNRSVAIALILMLTSCGGELAGEAQKVSAKTDPFADVLSKQLTVDNSGAFVPSNPQSYTGSVQSGEDPFKKFLENQSKVSN